MALMETVESGLKEAMKKKEEVRLKALRQIKAELMKLKTSGKPFTEEDEKAVIRRLVKQHRESIEAFEKGGRGELVDEEQQRLAIVESFLPAQMSGAALEAAVAEAVAAVGASSPKDMGKVMKHLKDAGVEADGRILADTVKTRLAAP